MVPIQVIVAEYVGATLDRTGLAVMVVGVVVVVVMGGASVLSLVLMGLDKRRAVRGGRGEGMRGGWRIPEATLHGLELIGGWPGSLLASRWFRHKTIKPGYRLVRCVCIVLHVVAVGAVFWLIC